MAHLYRPRCPSCASDFSSAKRHARYCTHACRQSAYRERQSAAERQRAVATDLLRRQTRAIIDGADGAVLDAIAREAELLLG